MKNDSIQKMLILSTSLFIFTIFVPVYYIDNNIVYGETNPKKVNLKIQDLSVAKVPTGTTEIQGKAVNNRTFNCTRCNNKNGFL